MHTSLDAAVRRTGSHGSGGLPWIAREPGRLLKTFASTRATSTSKPPRPKGPNSHERPRWNAQPPSASTPSGTTVAALTQCFPSLLDLGTAETGEIAHSRASDRNRSAGPGVTSSYLAASND